MPIEKLESPHDVLKEIDNKEIEPWESPDAVNDVVVLIVARKDVEFHCDPGLMDYQHVKLKKNPNIIAVATSDFIDGKYQLRNAQKTSGEGFSMKAKLKSLMYMRFLVGGVGVAFWNNIWKRTIPASWRK